MTFKVTKSGTNLGDTADTIVYTITRRNTIYKVYIITKYNLYMLKVSLTKSFYLNTLLVTYTVCRTDILLL